jgi:N utilization substance protein B
MTAEKPVVARRSSRRRAREYVIQGLYQWRVAGQDAAAIQTLLEEDTEFRKADRAMFSSLLDGILGEIDPIKARLAPFIDREFDDLSPVESAILLLGAYELGHQPETPYRVIINEGIELAKTFGGTDGHKYVNGVLDRLAAQLRPDEFQARRGR